MKWFIFFYYLAIALHLGRFYQKKIEEKFPLYFQMLRLARWSRQMQRAIRQGHEDCLRDTRKFGGRKLPWDTGREESYQKIKALREEKRLSAPKDGPPIVFSPESARFLYQKLRENDLFKAKSMERGGNKIIR